MRRSTFALSLSASALLLTGADQALKFLADAQLKGRPARELLGGIAVLQYATNDGGFLSFLSGIPDAIRVAVLVVLPLAFLAAALVWAFRRAIFDRSTLIGLSLLLGGGLGNLIDRIFRPGGRVVDYIWFRAGPLHTGIMNLADIYILFLVILMIFLMVAERKASAGLPPSDSTEPGQGEGKL